ncbi:MAG: V-type ATP synthase subunit F [Clostridiaceae bacterium]|nr:V-type ATP synthase subunit F [Clostridiaceae bacterium]
MMECDVPEMNQDAMTNGDLHKVGVIGEWESIVAFRALGLSVADARTAETALAQLNTWAKEGYAVIFLTEALAEIMGDVLVPWRLRVLPAVIIIPSSGKTPYLGRGELRAAVSKATGIDLIGQRRKIQEEQSVDTEPDSESSDEC